MNQQIKARWVEALRSGKYGQTSSYLSDSNGFCCLGVLCDLYILDHPNTSEWKQYDECGVFNLFSCNTNTDDKQSSHEILPYTVAKWAGFSEEVIYPTSVKASTNEIINCDITVRSNCISDEEYFFSNRMELRDKGKVSLAELNDEYTLSFNAIADVIETQL